MHFWSQQAKPIREEYHSNSPSLYSREMDDWSLGLLEEVVVEKIEELRWLGLFC
jgi:hypothetical protein